MYRQHVKRARVLTCVVAGVAFTWAGVMVPAGLTAQGRAAGVRPPGARDASAIGVARPAGSWGRAIEVPGLGALDKGRPAGVSSVSCGSAGNCVAGGYYTDGHRRQQGFVAVERHARWGRVIKVPGLGALNTGGYAEVTSVSCAAAGNCAAGGYYLDRHGHHQGFVAVERHGRWGTAMEVPGLGALNTGGYAEVTSVSCAAVGNCAAGGSYMYYLDHSYNTQGFVVSEQDGAWGQAIEVPGLAALNTGLNAEVTSVSCAVAGSCAAGGYYWDSQDIGHGFVAVEQDGAWGQAIEVPGLAALDKGGYYAEVTAVSCAKAGSCAAGGTYVNSHDHEKGFVASEQDGAWGQAIGVPGLGALDKGGYAGVTSVSCAKAGSCAAGGYYTDGHRRQQGFVASEQDGAWGRAIEVPGLGALSAGAGTLRGVTGVSSVSCGRAGSCAAGGSYFSGGRHRQGFVASQRNGRWGTAITVPGLRALNTGRWAEVTSVSCAPAGGCAAGGNYTDSRGHTQGFVVSQAG